MTVENNVAATPAEALLTRRSVRAFTPQKVAREKVERVLDLARYCANGSNIQPWLVHVVSGAARDRVSQAAFAAEQAGGQGHEEEYVYYPPEWFEPQLARRRALGKALYGLLGIEKGEMDKMRHQWARNYLFFDAPVGLFFSMDKRNEYGGWIDMGTFIQSVMVAARGEGLHTCPQQSWSKYHRIVREHVPLPDSHVLVCGMAMGYGDAEAVVNRLMPDKAPLSEFATFLWE